MSKQMKIDFFSTFGLNGRIGWIVLVLELDLLIRSLSFLGG